MLRSKIYLFIRVENKTVVNGISFDVFCGIKWYKKELQTLLSIGWKKTILQFAFYEFHIKQCQPCVRYFPTWYEKNKKLLDIHPNYTFNMFTLRRRNGFKWTRSRGRNMFLVGQNIEWVTNKKILRCRRSYSNPLILWCIKSRHPNSSKDV